MALALENIFRVKFCPLRIPFFAINWREFSKANVRIEKHSTLPPRYESHVELLKSKLYTPESINPKDLPHIFFHSFKHDILDILLLNRYIDRARALSPQLSVKGFALVLHTISKYLTHKFRQIIDDDNLQYEIIYNNNFEDVNLTDNIYYTGNNDDILDKHKFVDLFKNIIEFIIKISHHLPSRLRYSQSKDLGMISLSITKLNTLITKYYNHKLIKTEYYTSFERILKRIANEAPSKLPFFGIPELAALALALSHNNLSSFAWSKLALYDLSVEMVDKLELLLVEQQYTSNLLNDALSFTCSMDRANVDNRGFWAHISQFLTNSHILSLITANNAVVLANAISKRCNADKLLKVASQNLESVDPVNIPRVVSLGLFVSFRTKSDAFDSFLKYLNVELLGQLNCIQLTQVINCINKTNFDDFVQFNNIKNAVYDRINRLVADGKMTVQGSISILSSIISKEEFKPFPDSLISFIHANMSLVDQKGLNSLLRLESILDNDVSHSMVNDLIDFVKQRFVEASGD
ncbi:hypothetical protein BMR1_02g03190 [Babesia microti strain RI]|uniref:Uncharacterized protein n=1 Tax=Babesia microti (strain RI) TaxID=1133968 RepID=I7IGF9_BABMR|nr:hypothetical protein BMR1_02g03190 [Babesia microti strain RI]CCF73791.1 hypothetical protein BMR1_02g03190 [Babesia microti strain RI]|eukprot:XP_012648400.1 hypothetical protein BMR1_02g03190 [Babesia microti strain RI]